MAPSVSLCFFSVSLCLPLLVLPCIPLSPLSLSMALSISLCCFCVSLCLAPLSPLSPHGSLRLPLFLLCLPCLPLLGSLVSLVSLWLPPSPHRFLLCLSLSRSGLLSCLPPSPLSPYGSLRFPLFLRCLPLSPFAWFPCLPLAPLSPLAPSVSLSFFSLNASKKH